jgi:hypothetical protein
MKTTIGFALAAMLISGCEPGMLGISPLSSSQTYSDVSKQTKVPHLLVGVVGLNNAILEFPKTAHGNSAPDYVVKNVIGKPFGENLRGEFWVGLTRYTSDGTVLGSVDTKEGEVVNAEATDSEQNLYVVIADRKVTHLAS